MLKALSKITLAVATTAVLSACGVGVENEHQYSNQNRKDAKALTDLFEFARGTYTGTFTPADNGVAAQQGTLRLYVVSVRETANPDGSVRVRPALYGRFELDNSVTETDYLPMTGNYDELGNIDLSTLSAAAGAGGGGGGAGPTSDMVSLTIKGSVARDHASLEAANTQGAWGHFEGTRVSTEAAAPSAGENQEYRARLKAIYNRITGDYRATVDFGVERASVEIKIRVVETGGGGTGASIPKLVGQYRRLDFPSGIGERQLAINFDSLSGTISMTGVQGGGSVPGSNTFSGSGKWVNERLSVDLTDSRGNEGKMIATRKPSRD